MAPENDNSEQSPYTVHRGWPGAFEGETVSRRSFMTGVALGAGGLASAAFGLPALGFAIAPIFQKTVTYKWADVGPAADFNATTYLPRVITIVSSIGEAGKTTVYVRKNLMHDPDQPFLALSSRCAHLGCPVRFVAAAREFVCPCHGGTYDFEGRVAGGPPVRPLDRFYTKVAGGRVYIGERFSVNSKLQKLSPRDPGEQVNGIWEYLYPPRASTPGQGG